MNLFNSPGFSTIREINKTYIITIPHPESERLAQRCLESCDDVGQDATLFEGVIGNEEGIFIPTHLEYIPWYLFRVPSNAYSNSQIACFMSHFSLWMHCIEIDEPIVILEHDAIMVRKIEYAQYFNCIQFLGCYEQYIETLPMVEGIPPHASIYEGRWRSICRAHAYVIDPPIARNLIAEVVKYGMVKTLDIFIRADIFPIVQNGLYAYDLRGESTICELNGNEKDY